ncbi:MAG: acyltransferase [Cyanobacteria bacterium]|nr:acyltransferase [Cyanobacteriota bacterium]
MDIKFLAFLLGWWVYHPYSVLISIVLRLKGIHVGKGFYIQGVPYLKLRANPSNIIIGNNVKIYGDIDLRIRENGRIQIQDNVSFDTCCRLVSANNAVLTFKEYADIGGYCVFNAGTDILIDKHVLIAGYCYIQSSSHGLSRSKTIKSQPHSYGKVVIGEDSWLGSHVTVLPGVDIATGTVIGTKSVVTKSTMTYNIYAGVPAKKIGERSL